MALAKISPVLGFITRTRPPLAVAGNDRPAGCGFRQCTGSPYRWWSTRSCPGLGRDHFGLPPRGCCAGPRPARLACCPGIPAGSHRRKYSIPSKPWLSVPEIPAHGLPAIPGD